MIFLLLWTSFPYSFTFNVLSFSFDTYYKLNNNAIDYELHQKPDQIWDIYWTLDLISLKSVLIILLILMCRLNQSRLCNYCKHVKTTLISYCNRLIKRNYHSDLLHSVHFRIYQIFQDHAIYSSSNLLSQTRSLLLVQCGCIWELYLIYLFDMSAMKNGKIAPGPGKKYAPQSNGVDKIQNNSGRYIQFIHS